MGHSRPKYNSAVSTFCWAVANDESFTVNDRSTELELLYIDDLVEGMFALLEGKEQHCEFDGVEAVVLAAAGGHNMLMVGEPGCGKTMIAQRIPTILPEMTEEECLEVTKIYSISGLLPNGHALMKYRPFRAPHHNASLNNCASHSRYFQ